MYTCMKNVRVENILWAKKISSQFTNIMRHIYRANVKLQINGNKF